MKKFVLLTVLTTMALTLTMSSCRRNYEVNYARATEDTLKQKVDSLDAILAAEMDSLSNEQEEDTFYDMYEIPGDVSTEQILNPEKESAHHPDDLNDGQE